MTYVAMGGVVHVLDGDTFTRSAIREPTQGPRDARHSSGLLFAARIASTDGTGRSGRPCPISRSSERLIAWNGARRDRRIGSGSASSTMMASRSVLFPDIATAEIVAMAGVGRQLVVVGRRMTSVMATALAAWSDETARGPSSISTAPSSTMSAVADGALCSSRSRTSSTIVDGVSVRRESRASSNADAIIGAR